MMFVSSSNLKTRSKRAFTLIELLVVIVILGFLAAFVAPKVFKNFGKAKSGIARSKMALIENAIGRFQLDCGRAPEDLQELIEAPEGLEEKWDGRYCKPSDLLDPWGNPYIFEPEGEANPGSYDIISYGADGEEGGEDENADVVND